MVKLVILFVLLIFGGLGLGLGVGLSVKWVESWSR